jgi:hypothetical protein
MYDLISKQRETICQIDNKLEELKTFIIGDDLEQVSKVEAIDPKCLLDDLIINSNKLDYTNNLVDIILKAIKGGTK